MHEPDAENVYSIIGLTLTHLQSLERSLKFCTKFVIQTGDGLTWDRLQRIETEDWKKTLGQFVGMLRARARLHPKFEELLVSVLRDRNDFIHNTDHIAGWNLDHPEGIETATVFCVSLLRRVHVLHEILAALYSQWQQQAGIDVPTTPEQDAYFLHIENKYGHLVEFYFAHREA